MEIKEEVNKRLQKNTVTQATIGIWFFIAYLALSLWEIPSTGSLHLSASVTYLITFVIICVPLVALVAFFILWSHIPPDSQLLNSMSGKRTYLTPVRQRARKILIGLAVLWITFVIFCVSSAMRNDARQRERQAQLRSLDIEIARKQKEIEVLSAQLSQKQAYKKYGENTIIVDLQLDGFPHARG